MRRATLGAVRQMFFVNRGGSDHAWAGNHFVVGGSVAGRRIYGQYPSLAVNPNVGAEVNPLDASGGAPPLGFLG